MIECALAVALVAVVAVGAFLLVGNPTQSKMTGVGNAISTSRGTTP